jgi:hypothetical protein
MTTSLLTFIDLVGCFGGVALVLFVLILLSH